MNPRIRRAAPWLIVASILLASVAILARFSAGAPARPYGLAAQLGGTKESRIRLLKQTPTSLQFAVTLSNWAIAEETLTFRPNVPYNPTPAELTAQATRTTKVVGVRFSAAAVGNDVQLVLAYVVATDALPSSLRERLYGVAPTAGLWPVSRAWAQAGGSFWTGVDVAIQVKNASKQADQKPAWFKELDKAYGSAKKIDAALDKSAEYTKWTSELDALEECARHPTQTVTQNAYRDNPQYQADTLAAIAQAHSEVSQATGARYVNQEASIAMSLDAAGPFAQPIVTDMTDAVSKWNDSALQQVSDGLVSDASKLVDCNLARPPVRAAYNDGTIQYHMRRTKFYDYDEEEITVDGPIVLVPGPADSVRVTGEAGFKGRLLSSKSPTLSNSCEGRSQLEGGGGYGTIWIGARPAVTACSGTFSSGASESSFRCDFPSVDLVNGGDYEAHASGEEAPWAICTLHLKPSQKP